MKILYFIPLLIWALGFLWLSSWEEKWKTGVISTKADDYQAQSWVWVIGIAFWLAVAIALCRGWL